MQESDNSSMAFPHTALDRAYVRGGRFDHAAQKFHAFIVLENLYYFPWRTHASLMMGCVRLYLKPHKPKS